MNPTTRRAIREKITTPNGENGFEVDGLL